MIDSFGDRLTEDFYYGQSTARTRRIPPSIIEALGEKLDMVAAASALVDLAKPPGNRLEPLRGSWIGYHSIRVNDRWRLVFRWTAEGAEYVRLVDYH